MDLWQISLRLLHIVLGTFWAGTTIFFALFLQPQLRALGPSIERPVMKSLIKSLIPAVPIAAFVTIGTGVALALMHRWGSLDTFFTTGWGWSMVVAFVLSLAYFIVAFTLDDPATKGMEQLITSLEGREPSTDEAQRLEELNVRLRTAARIEMVLMFVIVGTMAVARYL